jgi:hypothetical protein
VDSLKARWRASHRVANSGGESTPRRSTSRPWAFKKSDVDWRMSCLVTARGLAAELSATEGLKVWVLEVVALPIVIDEVIS